MNKTTSFLDEECENTLKAFFATFAVGIGMVVLFAGLLLLRACFRPHPIAQANQVVRRSTERRERTYVPSSHGVVTNVQGVSMDRSVSEGPAPGSNSSEGPWFVVESDDPGLFDWYGSLDGALADVRRLDELMSSLEGVVPILLKNLAFDDGFFVLEFFNDVSADGRSSLGMRDLRIIVLRYGGSNIALRDMSKFESAALRLVHDTVERGLRHLREPSSAPFEPCPLVPSHRVSAFVEALRRSLFVAPSSDVSMRSAAAVSA